MHYDVRRGGRRATGLRLQIGGVCRLEWRRLEVAELLLAAE